IQRRTGIGVLNQKLAYIMRSGAPDMLDRMVAKNYGTMVVQALVEKKRGLMAAIQNGRYTMVPIDTCIQGTRRVDVESFYDPAEYRPRIAALAGKPMFLY
ncbi:MAG: phosphofructokinase, partial [Proteobacteria bacterium]|nr:phosphofructokinase [Pseudomonadota bacterium]